MVESQEAPRTVQHLPVAQSQLNLCTQRNQKHECPTLTLLKVCMTFQTPTCTTCQWCQEKKAPLYNNTLTWSSWTQQWYASKVAIIQCHHLIKVQPWLSTKSLRHKVWNQIGALCFRHRKSWKTIIRSSRGKSVFRLTRKMCRQRATKRRKALSSSFNAMRQRRPQSTVSPFWSKKGHQGNL